MKCTLTCIYVYIYMYIHTHTYAHTHTRTHTDGVRMTSPILQNVPLMCPNVSRMFLIYDTHTDAVRMTSPMLQSLLELTLLSAQVENTFIKRTHSM